MEILREAEDKLKMAEGLCLNAKKRSEEDCYCAINSNDMKGPCRHCCQYVALKRLVLEGRKLLLSENVKPVGEIRKFLINWYNVVNRGHHDDPWWHPPYDEANLIDDL